LLLAQPVLLPAAENNPAKPNIIVILIDDMGYGDIGPFGWKLNRTPNLDRLAAEVMKLTSDDGPWLAKGKSGGVARPLRGEKFSSAPLSRWTIK